MRKLLIIFLIFISSLSYSQIVYEDMGAETTNVGTTVTVAAPSVVNVNDMLFVMITSNNSNPSITPSDAGWNEITNEGSISGQAYLAWFRADGSEDSENFTFTLGTSTNFYAIITRFSGVVISGTPYETSGNSGWYSGSNYSTIGGTVTNATYGATFHHIKDNTARTSLPSGWGEEFAITTTYSVDFGFSLYSRAVTTGTYASEVATWSAVDYQCTTTLYLLPSAGDPVLYLLNWVDNRNINAINLITNISVDEVNGITLP